VKTNPLRLAGFVVGGVLAYMFPVRWADWGAFGIVASNFYHVIGVLVCVLLFIIGLVFRYAAKKDGVTNVVLMHDGFLGVLAGIVTSVTVQFLLVILS
jgi:hypothetical protein